MCFNRVTTRRVAYLWVIRLSKRDVQTRRYGKSMKKKQFLAGLISWLFGGVLSP